MLLGPASDVGRAVAARRPDLARRALARWRHLGVDAVVEIVDHLDHKSTFRAARLAELARDTRTPAVLTNAVRYLDPVDSLTAQVLDAARHLVPLGSPRLVPHNGRAYLASQEDMTAIAKRVAAAMTGPGTASAATLLLGETEELTRRCALDPARDLGVGSRHLPETEGTAYDQHKELRDRCEHAILHGRYRTASAASRPRGVSRLKAAEQARDRLEHELDIIAQTGMAAYFLTVADVATGSGTPASAARSGAPARAASSTTCSASARSTRSSTTCSWSGSCPRSGTRSRTSTWTWSRPAASTRTGSSSTATARSAPPASA